MTEQQDTPEGPHEADGAAGEPVEPRVVREQERVSIRRAPKLPVFLVLGAGLGAIVAFVLTAVGDLDRRVGFGATFGYLALYGIPAGIVLGAIVALVLDRRSRRRAAEVTVEHESMQEPDEQQEPDTQQEPDKPGESPAS
ncbi:hypothetical protein [Homoserinimonas aerilata]|nr:hypothetical protein [Homoserinimonas aerilata]